MVSGAFITDMEFRGVWDVLPAGCDLQGAGGFSRTRRPGAKAPVLGGLYSWG